MGYYLRAIIGAGLKSDTAAPRAARIVLLKGELQMIPLTDELFDELGGGEPLERFEKLSEEVEGWVKRLCPVARVAYVEAEYFGGVGGQSAIAWYAGSRVLGPIHAEDAINQALGFLGVHPDGVTDEFDAVGLGRHRSTDDWLVEST